MNLIIRESRKTEGLFFIFLENDEQDSKNPNGTLVGSLDFEDGVIQNFGIDTKYQNKKIGQSALLLFLDMIGPRPIKLDVMQDNPRAIHVYKKCGFEINPLVKSSFYYVMEKK